MPTFKHRCELVSGSENKNDSEPAEPADHEPVVPASTLDSVTEDSGSVAVLSNHNGKTLCTRCRGISIESLTAHGGYMHAPSPEALSIDCALCTLIEPYVWRQHGQVSISVCGPDLRTKNSIAYLNIDCCGNGRDRSRIKQIRPRISIIAPQEDPALDFRIPAIASLTTTASPQSFETAKRWLRDCISHHTCSESPHYLVNDKPSRLLDLDAFGDYSTAVRLQDASPVHGNYAALSYCWGTIQQQRFMTTSGTLDSRTSRIDYCEVPRSFQHAFQICNALGIRYLWIDALSILQDSVSDWETESTKMGAIYSNAHVTIAADWSPDVNGGCYHFTAGSTPRTLKN